MRWLAIIGGLMFVSGVLLMIFVLPGIMDKIFDDVLDCSYGYDNDTGEVFQYPCEESDEALEEVTPFEGGVLFYTLFSLLFSLILAVPWTYRNRQRLGYKILGALIGVYYIGVVGLMIYAALFD